MKKKVIIGIVAGALAIGVIGISAIGSYLNNAKAAATDVREHTSEAQYVDEEVDAVMGVNSRGSINAGATVKKTFAADSNAAPEAQAEQGPSVSSQVNVDPNKGRLLIRTVTITAETKDFGTVVNNVNSQVKACGGYIENSSMRGTGNNHDLRSGTYVVRVPADKLDELIASVGSSCTVTSSNENSSDVTLEYVDTKSRVESLRVEYDQLMKILSETKDLDNIIVLQKRLTEVRYQIESSESRLRVLENQVQYATLHLTLKEVLEEKEVEEAHVVTYSERVKDQFKDMWEGTVEFFQDFGLGLISAIPMLVFLAIVAVVVIIIVSSVRRKRRKNEQKILADAKVEVKAEKDDSSKDEKKDA